MRLPIVDNAHRPVELDWLRIQQVRRADALRNQLEVRRDERDARLRYLVSAHDDDASTSRHLELDAHLAGEIVAAVRALIERTPIALETKSGTDPYRYEIELSWSGVEFRVEVDGEPVDDALRGVIDLASTLLDRDPHVTRAETADDQPT